MNCHVVSAGSLLQLLDNFVDAALEEGVPQVEKAFKSLCVPTCWLNVDQFVQAVNIHRTKLKNKFVLYIDY